MSLFRSLCILTLLVLAGQANSADALANIYAYVDADGKLTVSKKKDDARFVRFDPKRQVTPKVTMRKAVWTTRRIGPLFVMQPQDARQDEQQDKQTTIVAPMHHKALHYTPLINTIADEVGINANLLHAMIQVESAYNPVATSPKGAQGLMQLIPATAERFGVEAAYDPEANVRGGAKYIRNLLARFDNNLQLALAAYNAGEGAVEKYNNSIPPYPETQAYVGKVVTLFKRREE